MAELQVPTGRALQAEQPSCKPPAKQALTCSHIRHSDKFGTYSADQRAIAFHLTESVLSSFSGIADTNAVSDVTGPSVSRTLCTSLGHVTYTVGRTRPSRLPGSPHSSPHLAASWVRSATWVTCW